MSFAQIQWPEVLVVGLILQLVVVIQNDRVFVIFTGGHLPVAVPVQLVLDDFYCVLGQLVLGRVSIGLSTVLELVIRLLRGIGFVQTIVLRF